MKIIMITKRSGQEVQFNAAKIEDAIRRASNEVSHVNSLSEDRIKSIAQEIQSICEARDRAMHVEEIQDLVENRLMDIGAYAVAKQYIVYRYKRALSRNSNTTDEQILSLIECNNEDVKQENSNKNPSINSVQRDYMAGEVSKDVSARILLPQDVVQAHKDGLIHFHDMDYYAQHMHNCFASNTKFITDRGIKSFKDFKDGDKVVVRDKFGKMREATVHSFGVQELYDVTFSNGIMQHKVSCTRNHRWILEDGSVTTELKEGDALFNTWDSTETPVETFEDARMFCLGFAIGDGCDHKGANCTQVRLCGNKRQLHSTFELAGWRKSDTKSDAIVFHTPREQKQAFLDGKVWKFLNYRQQEMLFKGLYAADGVAKATRISTADPRVLELIKDTSAMAGYYITSIREDVRDTNFKKDAHLWTVELLASNAANRHWRVNSIRRNRHQRATVWCVTEPITHTFTLEKGIVTGNCDLVNLEDMLQNGTVISGTMIEKPKSFSTACNIATQIIAQVASNQYGGQSISLTHLAPFVDVSRQTIRKELQLECEESGFSMSADKFESIIEKRVRREVERGVQTIQYQVVTLMTTNGQAPFITVFMYLGEARSEQEKKDLAIIIEEVLKERIRGVKNEQGVYVTPAFPKLIYVLEEQNIRKDAPYWYLTELAAKCTAKRMVPDYISEKKMKEYKIDSNGDGNCYTCMGCRSFLTPWVDPSTGKGKYYGRFNQGVVTVNLVDVALSSHGDMDHFWQLLEHRCELCHKALQCRHERLTGTLSDAAPILWQYGALTRLPKGTPIDKYLHGGYSTISLGYAGLWECVYALNGKKLTEPEGEKLGLAIMQKLNDYTSKWKEAEDIHYSLYGTPMESTTYRFAKCLQRRFGIIKGITDRNYITNSYHIHVSEPLDAFTKLAIESKFQRLSPGGAISYVEVPNMQNNIPAVLAIIQFIYDNIMYAELNTKSDYCQCCGFDGEIEIVKNDSGKLIWKCPKCGNTDESKLNVARRTCGYIGSQFWNQGRTQEIKDRVLHVS